MNSATEFDHESFVLSNFELGLKIYSKIRHDCPRCCSRITGSTAAGQHASEKVCLPLTVSGACYYKFPQSFGLDAYANLGSASKRLLFFTHSGHHPMNTEPAALQQAVIDFIEGIE